MFSVKLAFWQGTMTALFICWFSICMACLEIEIEGKNGWASNLPTWRRKSWLCGARPWTGYHTALAIAFISAVLAGSVTGSVVLEQPNSGSNALLGLSVFTATMATEDSYWYIMNYVFWDAVKKNDAHDHFSLTSRIMLYTFCSLVAYILWNLAFGLFGQWLQGTTSFGVLLGVLLLLNPLIRIIVAPIYKLIRTRLDGTSVKNQEDVRHSLFLLAAVLFAIELGILSAGLWECTSLVSKL